MRIGFGSVFNDAALGYAWMEEPTEEVHTRADVLVSVSVLVGMVVVWLGYPVVDAILALAIAVLIALIFSKFFYMASMTSYYTFYLIDLI